MGGGYSTPPGDSVDQIARQNRKVREQLRDLQRPTGTQIGKLYDQVQQALANIVTQVADAAAAWMAANAYTSAQVDAKVASPGAISPTTVSASGAIASAADVSGASGTFSSSLSSPGAYGTDVSALPGGREATWQHNSGVFGFAPSTKTAKTNAKPVAFTAADVRAVLPYLYQYRSQIAIRTDPQNAHYDPTYTVPWEVGLMAEDLIAHNMGCFVVFEPDGVTPKTINYDLFGAVVPLVLDADINARLKKLGA